MIMGKIKQLCWKLWQIYGQIRCYDIFCSHLKGKMISVLVGLADPQIGVIYDSVRTF